VFLDVLFYKITEIYESLQTVMKSQDLARSRDPFLQVSVTSLLP